MAPAFLLVDLVLDHFLVKFLLHGFPSGLQVGWIFLLELINFLSKTFPGLAAELIHLVNQGLAYLPDGSPVNLLDIIASNRVHGRNLPGHFGGKVVLLTIISLYVEELQFTRGEVAQQLVVADDDGTDRRMVMAGIVVDDAGCGTFHPPLVSIHEHITQASAVDTLGKRVLASTQVMESGKEVPLHDGHIALGPGLDAGPGNHGWHADAALENRALAFLEWSVEPAVLPIDFTLFGSPAAIVGSEDDVGVL